MNAEMRASNYETRMDNEVVPAVFKWTGSTSPAFVFEEMN
jgi:hypothetical protein